MKASGVIILLAVMMSNSSALNDSAVVEQSFSNYSLQNTSTVINDTDELRYATTLNDSVQLWNLTTPYEECNNESRSNNETLQTVCKNTTQHSNGTNESFSNIILEACKQLFSSKYWQQRIHNHQYWMDTLTIVLAEIILLVITVLCGCCIRSCCRRRRHHLRKKNISKIKPIKQDKNKDSVQWTLLEKNSSDEEI